MKIWGKYIDCVVVVIVVVILLEWSFSIFIVITLQVIKSNLQNLLKHFFLVRLKIERIPLYIYIYIYIYLFPIEIKSVLKTYAGIYNLLEIGIWLKTEMFEWFLLAVFVDFQEIRVCWLFRIYRSQKGSACSIWKCWFTTKHMKYLPTSLSLSLSLSLNFSLSLFLSRLSYLSLSVSVTVSLLFQTLLSLPTFSLTSSL